MPRRKKLPWRKSPLSTHPYLRHQGPAVRLPQGCRLPLWRGQQGSRGFSSYQVIHQSPLTEIGLGAEHGSSLKQFQNNWVYQDSEGHLQQSCQGSQSYLCSVHKEAKTLCSMAIRDGETWGASQASSLQKSYTKSILHLEEQAIKEENRSQLNFLSACQTTLQASPAELHSVLVASYQVLMGQLPMSLLLNPSQVAYSSGLAPTPAAPSLPALEPLPRPKW